MKIKPRIELIDGKYKEKIHAYPIRVDKGKYIHLEKWDAPEFIYKHIPGHVLKAQALNTEWCYEVWQDMLVFSHEDPTLTMVFEYGGILHIDTTDSWNYRTMKLRDWLSMVYERDHQFFPRKNRPSQKKQTKEQE